MHFNLINIRTVKGRLKTYLFYLRLRAGRCGCVRCSAVMSEAERLCAGLRGYERGGAVACWAVMNGAVMSGGVKIRAFNAIYNCLLLISRRKNRKG